MVEKCFKVEDILCIATQVDNHWCGYAIFPAEYLDIVENAHNAQIEITWFNDYGFPPLLRGHYFKGVPLEHTDFCYLGADTAHLYNENTYEEIKQIVTDIVKWVKSKHETEI